MPKAAWWNGSQLTVLSGRKTSRNGCWIDSQQGLAQEFPGGPPVRFLGFHCHVPGQRSLLAACCCAVHSWVQLFVTPWTVAHQAPLSMQFSRQEYQSRLPFPSPESCMAQQKKKKSCLVQSYVHVCKYAFLEVYMSFCICEHKWVCVVYGCFDDLLSHNKLFQNIMA